MMKKRDLCLYLDYSAVELRKIFDLTFSPDYEAAVVRLQVMGTGIEAGAVIHKDKGDLFLNKQNRNLETFSGTHAR